MRYLDSLLIETTALRETKGRFGVEIEVEGMKLPPEVFGWDVHKEGSLRGEAKEYVTRGAVDHEELEDKLLILNQVVDAFGADIFNSHRASVHIHVNCQKMTCRQIIGAILAFTMVEPVFMRLCGQTRDGNLFCLPSYDCGDLAEWMSKAGEMFAAGGGFGVIHKRGKYSALNTDPLTRFGTLEFRTFPTSTQVHQIMQWAHWCDMVVKTGTDMKGLSDSVAMFSRGPMPVLQRIFGDAIKQFSMAEIAEMVDIGAEVAFEAAQAFEAAIEVKKAA